MRPNLRDGEYIVRLSAEEDARVDAEHARTGRSREQIVAMCASRGAMRLPPPSPTTPPRRRSLSEIREQRRIELGGPTPYTTEIQTITTDRSQPS